MDLLTKIRKINAMLQKENGTVDYTRISEILCNVVDANVFIVGREGDLVGFAILQEIENDRMRQMLEERQFPKEYTDGLLDLYETTSNLDVESKYTAFPVENKDLFQKGLTTIVPIVGGGNRLGTLVISRLNATFQDDDLILAEYGATVVGMEILREKSEAREEEVRSKTVVQIAMKSLSFSEIEAIESIFAELGGAEGLLVASKIADRVGVTRSVIVNALRKLESAGVIETRSLGMKGTHIKVLNDNFLDNLAVLQA